MNDYLLFRYWWLALSFAVVWFFTWQVIRISAFVFPTVQVHGMSFSVGEPVFESAQYHSDFLWSNWQQAPENITNDIDTEIFQRELPECHSRNLSVCDFPDDQKVFWGNVDEYVWRTDTSEKRLLQDTSLAQFPTQPFDLIISEVSWAGSYLGDVSLSTDEWIELYNPTENIWNLRGLKILGVRRNNATLTIQGDHFVGPYSYFLVGKATGDHSLLRFAPDYVFSTLILSNTQANIRVFSKEDVVLDTTPPGVWQAGSNDTQSHQRATAQRNIFAPTEDWRSWITCSSTGISACQEKAFAWKENTHHTLGTPWQASLF